MDVFLTLSPNFRFPVVVGIIKTERQIKDKFLSGIQRLTVYVNLIFILMRKSFSLCGMGKGGKCPDPRNEPLVQDEKNLWFPSLHQLVADMSKIRLDWDPC